MTALTLFDLAQQVRDAVNQIDPETGEIIENYADSRELFQQKGVACVAYAKTEAANLEAAEQLLKQMQDQIKARASRLERFKAYIADGMKFAGITEIKDGHAMFGAKLYLERDESIEIDPDATFPPDLCNDPKPPAPSKSKIKAAIKRGEPIAGARIVRNDRLQFT